MNRESIGIGLIYGGVFICVFLLAVITLNVIETEQNDTPETVQCCGDIIHDLHKRIDTLQKEVYKQTQQKLYFSMENQPLSEQIRELESELEACRAHVMFGEPYEAVQVPTQQQEQ